MADFRPARFVDIVGIGGAIAHVRVALTTACLCAGCMAPDGEPVAELPASAVPHRSAVSRDIGPDLARIATWQAVEEWRVGAEGSAVEFDRVRSMAVGDDGRLFVLAGSDGVVVLDTAGRLSLRFGPRGEGPGELKGAWAIDVANDTVFVLQDQLELFRTDGSFLDRRRPPNGTFRDSHRMSYTDRGLAVFRYNFVRPRQDGRNADTLEIRFVDAASGVISPVTHRLGMTSFRLPQAGFEVPTVLGGYPGMAATRAGDVVETDAEDFSIVIRAFDGSIREHAVADVPRVSNTRDDLNDLVAEARGGDVPQDRRVHLERGLREAPRARYRQAIGRMVVSTEGHVLLERPDLTVRPFAPRDMPGSTVWHIIGRDMVPAGAVTLNRRFVPMVFDGCRLFGVLTDEYDTPIVARYRLTGVSGSSALQC